jgi:ribosomal protein S18 acetylase RimI-like enzyme
MIIVKESKDSTLLAELNRDIQELHHEIVGEIFKEYSQKEWKKQFEEDVKKEGVYIYVAYFNEMPAGYIMVSAFEYSETVYRKKYKVINIDSICVAKKYQRKGIGKALMDKALEVSQKEKINRIELDYWNKNIIADSFFRGMGFEPFNTRMKKTVIQNGIL